MSKYQLTTEQFKEFIMPFFEEAKEKGNAKSKDYNFKFLKVASEDQTQEHADCQDFKVEYIAKGKRHYVVFTIANADIIWDSDWSKIVSEDSSLITDPVLVEYLRSVETELESALWEYVYKLYGEEYKDYLIKRTSKNAQENAAKWQPEIDEMRAKIEEEKAKLEKLQKDLALIIDKKNHDANIYDKQIQIIENLLNPHQV